jgi:Ca2+-transporting ATPase
MESKKQGLTSKEARIRLKKYGLNEIKRQKKRSPTQIFLSQFTSPLILILIGAAIISLAIGTLPNQESNLTDTILILAIVLISGISGFFQDYKAEKTIEALQKLSTPKAKVIRDGKQTEIEVTKLVPGDIILLEAGDIVPADAIILECFNLKVDEAVLTGESRSVEKKPNDQIFMNTFVYVGNAKALVTKTGMQTKVGKIAEKLQEIKEEKTPFQKEISKFSKKTFIAIISIVIIIGIIGYFKYGLYQSLLTAISLAVAAIPEGLPAVIVLTLAIGARVMSKNNALVRKLSVTESVGSVDIICTDKTGTLTRNEMTVTKLYFNNKTLIPKNKNEIRKILLCSALCNNSSIIHKNKKKKYIGDPTEIALRKFSESYSISKEKLEEVYKKINEYPFSSKRKMMSVIYKQDSNYFVFSKGAPEILLKKCNKIYINNKIISLNEKLRQDILEKNKEFASQSLRVIALAFKEVNSLKQATENNLIWLSLVAMKDPPRKGVKNALKECKTAGIRVIMLTGDHPITAQAIAKEIGLETNGIVTGQELDKMTDKQLEHKLNENINIFARISPFHKLRILEILKKEKRVVMTGDGVNDALALKKADVGISMGIRGTEVAKEASDIILLDDDFSSIKTAIKEGRRIFDNIRKFVNYLFVCNFAEVFVLFLAVIFLALNEPILFPIQILWINLLTDGFPALALGIDPPRKDIMHQPPRKKNESIINKKLGYLILLIGSKKTLILLVTFLLTLPLGLDTARTTLFTGFILYEFVRIGSIRQQEKLGWLSNKWLLAALTLSLILQLSIIYTPLNTFFKIKPLGFYEWTILLAGVVVGYLLAILITSFVMKYVKE